MNESPTKQPMAVSVIMSRQVATVTPETSVKDIAKLLVERHITGVPVVKGDAVVGIVTEADLVMQKARIHIPTYISLLDSTFYLEDPSLVEVEIAKILGATAEQVMTKDVVTIADTATVEDLATLFEEQHVNPVPVVDVNGKLAGIVSRADVVRLLVREGGANA